MLDLGMLMYGSLLVLAVWRSICFYRCCGVWLSCFNYTSLLYVLLAAFTTYSLMELYQAETHPVKVNHPEADAFAMVWLQPFVLSATPAVCITVVLCWFQTDSHVFEIHKALGQLKHDRAVQIVALPAVFAVAALASLVPMYELVRGHIGEDKFTMPYKADIQDVLGKLVGAEGNASLALVANAAWPATEVVRTPDWEEAKQVAMWRYETCFYVADLFEAWALFQFGKLALEIIRDSIAKRKADASEPAKQTTRDLLAMHDAVQWLTWLGTLPFVLVCVAQTACSLWPYFGGASEMQAFFMTEFLVAGVITSSAALLNIFIVERAFHQHLERCWPVMKFLSVKVLVSLSFFQRGILLLLQTCNSMLPAVMQKIVRTVPWIGDIVNMTEVQLRLFYPALVLFECLLVALAHIWAWNAGEDWYKEQDECTPLVKGAQPCAVETGADSGGSGGTATV